MERAQEIHSIYYQYTTYLYLLMKLSTILRICGLTNK